MSGPQFDQFGNQIPDPNAQDGEGIKALRKAIKAKGKENEELKERIAALEAQSRSGSVADYLGQHGLDPRVAKFYPGDKPTTADAVAEWVDENRELFPVQQTNNSDPSKTTLTEDQQRGYELMRLLGEAEAATALDFKSRADACETEEEFMALLAEFGDAHPFG